MEGVMKLWPVWFLALVACGGEPTGNAMTNADVPDGPMPAGAPPLPQVAAQSCAMPKLDFRAAGNLTANDRSKFTGNFRVALDKACAEGLLEGDPIVDERAHVRDTIFVMNAPEANVTSLYFGPSAAPPAMLLESPFGDPPQIPSVEDLHEAIYCWTRGATEQEQETSGRCLPD
jgi:hypothetical protein